MIAEELRLAGTTGRAPDSAALRSAFLARCEALDAAEVGCVSQAKDETALYSSCSGALAAFQASVRAALSKEARAGIDRETAMAELDSTFRLLRQSAEKALPKDAPTSATFRFPSSPPTPGRPCCELGGVCSATGAEWETESWRSFGFRPPRDLHWQLAVFSEGSGAQAAYVVRAIGDPACDGNPEQWESRTSISPGGFLRWEDAHPVSP